MTSESIRRHKRKNDNLPVKSAPRHRPLRSTKSREFYAAEMSKTIDAVRPFAAQKTINKPEGKKTMQFNQEREYTEAEIDKSSKTWNSIMGGAILKAAISSFDKTKREKTLVYPVTADDERDVNKS